MASNDVALADRPGVSRRSVLKRNAAAALRDSLGTQQIRAQVTTRIAPGVLSNPQGAWFKPNDKGTDTGGPPITTGNAQHTTLAQLRKA